ncbi:MAG: hypothetical protein IJF05_03570 [Clostridia bacterium]|nr:hypothetical protein [Clostridia bacterium]
MTKNNEFNIKTLWRVIVAFWLVIAIATAAGAVAGGVYSLLRDKTVYTAYASFWVNVKATGGVSQSSTMGAAQLATNYVELADSTALLTRAVKDGNLSAKWNTTEDNAVKALRSMISAGKTDVDSLMFTVYITSGDANLTYDAISAVQQSMVTVIGEVNNDGSVVRVAEVYSLDDVYASRPSPLKKAVIGAAAAFVLSYAICFAIFIFDKRARGTEEVKAATDLPVIAFPEHFYRRNFERKISPADEACAYATAAERVIKLAPENARVIALLPTGYADTDAVLSLADVYAGEGKRTLVVECDSRIPLITDMLDCEDGELVGLDKFIEDGSLPTVTDFGECLDVIAVGGEGEGYISVRYIKALLDAVGGDYDKILLSLPAAELMTDLSQLALIADCAVESVCYGESTDRLEKTRELLESLGINVSAVYFLPL